MAVSRTGFIGLGAMGSNIAATLLRARIDLTVFDIDEAKTNSLVRAGAVRATSVDTLAEACDVVLLSLPSSRTAVTLLGELLPHASNGLIAIDVGTTSVLETERLSGLFAQTGGSLVDAPVSGGPIGSAQGKLLGFVGGDRSTVTRVWPLLELFCGERLTYCGGSGKGQVAKYVNQLAMAFTSAAHMEAIGLGVAAGVPAATLVSAIGGTSGFRAEFDRIGGMVAAGLGANLDIKYSEFGEYLELADSIDYPAFMLRALSQAGKDCEAVGRDTMGRPFPPYWTALHEKGTNQ